MGPLDPLFFGHDPCPNFSHPSLEVAHLLESAGKHALSCKQGDGHTSRHTVLRNIIHRYNKELGISGAVEYHLHNARSSSSPTFLRTDLSIPCSYGLVSRNIALDVTATHLHAQSRLFQCDACNRAASNLADPAKHSQRSDTGQALNLLSVGIGVCGVPVPKKAAFLHNLATFAAALQGSPLPLYLLHIISLHSFCLRGIEAGQALPAANPFSFQPTQYVGIHFPYHIKISSFLC